MKAARISDKIWALHADIETDDLFEGIWPIPDGVSLNSYLVKGEKVALIDLVRDWSGAADKLKAQLETPGHKHRLHRLPHTQPPGTRPYRLAGRVQETEPRGRDTGHAKGVELVKSFYKIEDGLRAVKSGDSLD
jgi:anaerobic nitric oxide reductase flavorubredoxin